jgi:transposase
MEDWAKQWLKTRREAGESCLEIKYINGKHYVYHSTSTYDKVIKKPKKISSYIGRLDPLQGLIPKGSGSKSVQESPRNVKEYGNSRLLHDQLKELVPLLQENFPACWEEIVAMTLTRVPGYVPLKRIGDIWEKYENIWDIAPSLEPRNLSKILHEVGTNRAGQQSIFAHLTTLSQQLVYDLSMVFTRSMSIHEAEKGYNRGKVFIPQINLALFCSIDTGLPTMIRSLPGSVRDVATLVTSINEVELNGKVLVLDRGFIAEDLIPVFQKRKIDFVQPTRRNSTYYSQRIHMVRNFMFKDRLIHAGKKKIGELVIYLYEDEDMALEERKTLYSRFNEEKISRVQLNTGLERAGHILIISSLDWDEQKIYEMYKSRDMVEKHFDTYKTELMADKLYLRDSESLFGHAFIGFLCLYVYCKLLNLVKNAGLTDKISPADLLTRFSKVYHVHYYNFNQYTEVPKQVRTLEKKLGIDIFPKVVRS